MDFKYVSAMPIKLSNKNKQREIIDLVDRILKETNSEKIKELKEKINNAVYKTYGLTLKQIKLIEDSYEWK